MKISSFLCITMLFISSCSSVPLVAPTESSTATISAPAPTTVTPTSINIPMTTPTSPSTVTSVATVTANLQAFGTVTIDPADIEFDVNSSGSNVDSIAFWEAPDATESLMIVTSKGNEFIEVYKYPFTSELRTVSCGEESNGIWIDQETDILYVTERNSSTVCAYDLPSLEQNTSLSFTTAATGDDSEPNLTMLKLSDGQKRIYVSYDDLVYYHDAETGDNMGEFTPAEGLETMYGDDYYQVIYIPDEGDRSGVYIYDADGNPAGSKFGDSSIFDSDAEGIGVYECLSNGTTDNGEGLIVVADQKDDSTDFEVFDRRTREHLGTLNISGVNNTDGISITQQSSAEYPLGLFAVIDDDTSTIGVGWDTIFAKTGLSCSG